MFYTYRNTRLLINSSGINATNAQINLQANLSPSYLSSDRHSYYYGPTEGIGGSLNLTYYLTGHDPLKVYIANEKSVINVNFGGLFFNSGYLRSYSLKCSPNESAKVTAEIVFFDALKGQFSPVSQPALQTPVLNFGDIGISDLTNGKIGSLSGIISLNYDFSSDIQPLWLAGETEPNRIVFGEKTIAATIVTDILSGDLPVSGKEAGVKITFNHPHGLPISESLEVSGVLYQRNIETSVNSLVRSTLSIKQNYVDFPPTITSFSASSLTPGSRVRIMGTNLAQVHTVYFGDSPAIFLPVNGGELTGIVPEDVVDGTIKVVNGAGVGVSETVFTPTQNPILISGLFPPTGVPSGIVRISGNYFYRVSSVVFNSGVSSSFNVISPNLIEAIVPTGAKWGPIWVHSNERALSGISPQRFVPVPEITGFTPTTGITGQFITIQGFGFSGITGVLFNNLPNITPFTTSFTVNSNTNITAQVPTGNFRGRIKLLGQSGVSVTSLTSFGASVLITGLSPVTARTGTALEILGSNFYSDILYPIPGKTNTFLVAFGNNGITGEFIRVNSNRLTGLVPYNAKSGSLYLYDPNLIPHQSTGHFRLRHQPPTLSGNAPQTGFHSGYAVIEGSNLFELSSLQLIGPTGTITITNPFPYVSSLGDLVTFIYPVATGGYYHITATTPQGSATLNSGLFIRTIPIITTITPSSGALGQTISITGRNLYPDSRIFINNTGTQATVVPNSVPTGHNSIQFYLPVGTQTGLNSIIIYNQFGWATGANAIRLVESPRISGVFPNSGAYNDIISISGRNLGNVTGVYFGTGHATIFTKINNTGITATVPTTATTDYIRLVYGGGVNVYSTGIFTVLSPPLTLGAISPSSGYWQDTISVAGTNLDYAEYVYFSGSTGLLTLDSTEFTVVGTTGITVQIPNGTSTGPIHVRSDRYITNTAGNLTIIATPTISWLSQNTGVFGSKVYFSGANLGSCSFLFYNINTGIFIAANNISINSAGTSGSFTVPREIINGPVVVSGLGRIWQGTSGLFYPLPTIKAFAPTTLTTGSTLTLSGINAANILNNALFITGDGEVQNIASGLLNINYSQISGNGILNYSTGHTVITLTVNNNFVGTGALFLVNSIFSTVSGTESLLQSSLASGVKLPSGIATGNLTITQGPPSITTFTPIKGNNNTLVTIEGVNLRTATGVYLVTGSSQTICSIVSVGQSLVTFNPPSVFAPRSGQLRVYTRYGNATSSNWFTYINNPHISGIFPTQGITGDWIKISGSGIQDITGLYFGDYSAPFSIIQAGNVYQVSGKVPYTVEGLHRGYSIKIMSEAGSYTFNNHFTVRPGPTEIWGNLTGKGTISTTGLVLMTGAVNQSGVIMAANFEVESGRNFLVVNNYVDGFKVRMFSICLTGT